MRLVKRTQDVLQSNGNLQRHKIVSNSKEVLSAFSHNDLTKDLKTADIIKKLIPLQYSVGLAWDLNSDTFTFKLQDSQVNNPFTRRGLLSTNSLFDPLGFLALGIPSKITADKGQLLTTFKSYITECKMQVRARELPSWA